MSAEFWAILGVGVSLALLLYQFTNGLRSDVNSLRGEVNGLRNYVSGEINGLRGEVNGLRGDVSSEINGLRGDVNGLRGDIVDLRERMSKLEGLFEGYVRGDYRTPTPS